MQRKGNVLYTQIELSIKLLTYKVILMIINFFFLLWVDLSVSCKIG